MATEMFNSYSVEALYHEGDDTNLETGWSANSTNLMLSRSLGALTVVFALTILAGYFGNLEPLYRPIADGAATHPLTATIFLLLGIGAALGRGRTRLWLQRILGVAGVVMTAFALLDTSIGTSISTAFTLFQDRVLQDLAEGTSNKLSINSAIFLLLASMALTLDSLHRVGSAQAFAFLAGGVPMISLVGYAYGIENFYGQMSLTTATAAIALSVSVFARTAHGGALRAVLSPHIGGRIAQAQVLLSVTLPFSIGFLFMKTLLESGQGDFLGSFVVVISWSFIALVCVSAVAHEMIDRKRRLAEKELLFGAMCDPLTHLPNRRKFYEVGEREIARIKRTGADLSVLMIDIDHFKQVNDTAGHSVGDQVLKCLAKVLVDNLRAIDLPGRLGGDEFAVILPDTPLIGAQQVATKIQSSLEVSPIEGWTDTHSPITVSIGLADARHKKDLNDILSAADEALYISKKQGRNLVTGIE